MAKPKSELHLVKVALYMGAEQKRRLDELSAATRVPWSAFVREAVDDLLKKYRRSRSATNHR
jgi:predicted DNA-binding protein